MEREWLLGIFRHSWQTQKILLNSEKNPIVSIYKNIDQILGEPIDVYAYRRYLQSLYENNWRQKIENELKEKQLTYRDGKWGNDIIHIIRDIVKRKMRIEEDFFFNLIDPRGVSDSVDRGPVNNCLTTKR